jgi:hypothetical protein
MRTTRLKGERQFRFLGGFEACGIECLFEP